MSTNGTGADADAGAVLGPYTVAGRSAFVTVEPTAEALHDTLARALAPFAGDGLRLDGDGKGPCEVRLRVRADDHGYVVTRKRAVLHEGLADGEVPSRLFDVFDEVARGACARRLLGAPGAVVAHGDQAVLLVGDRAEAEDHAARLMRQGLRGVSAGWVLLDPDGALVAHPRPLGDGTSLPASQDVTVAAVVLLGAEVEAPTRTGPTEGGAEFLARTDEVVRAAAALTAVAPLAAGAAFIAWPQGAPVDATAVEQAVSAAPSDAVEVDAAPPPMVVQGGRDDAVGEVEVASRVASLLLPDGALVHDPRTGGLHRLDVPAAILWDGMLDGMGPDAIRAEIEPHVAASEHAQLAETVAAFYAWAIDEGLVVELSGVPR